MCSFHYFLLSPSVLVFIFVSVEAAVMKIWHVLRMFNVIDITLYNVSIFMMVLNFMLQKLGLLSIFTYNWINLIKLSGVQNTRVILLDYCIVLDYLYFIQVQLKTDLHIYLVTFLKKSSRPTFYYFISTYKVLVTFLLFYFILCTFNSLLMFLIFNQTLVFISEQTFLLSFT